VLLNADLYDTEARSFGTEKEPASLWKHTELPNTWQGPRLCVRAVSRP
jgi:hypothetical protein